MQLKDLIIEADFLKKEIVNLRPISNDLEQKIIQKFRLDWNYHSNNLEGNSLTYGETKSFLLHGLTAQGKPLKDHLDIKGHNEAILWLDDILKNNTPLTEKFIRELHQLILVEPYDAPALTIDGQPTTKRIHIGEYKRQPNHVKTATGEMFYFASPEETPAKMNDLLDWYNTVEDTTHPIILAAAFHYKFITIHPFDDGNGRICRILMNLILMKNGYTPVVIKTNKKDEYYRALRLADGGEESFFDNYIAEQEIESLKLYLSGARGEEIEDEDDIDKKIALFKASINVEDAKEERSLSIQVKLYEKSLFQLFESINQKISKFNDLFKDIEFRLDLLNSDLRPYDKINYESTKSLQSGLLKLLKETSTFSGIGIWFKWVSFDHSDFNPFSIETVIVIELSRYKYIITCPDLKLEKCFHIDLSEKDIKKFATKIASDVLSKIEAETLDKKDE
jgi:Fic family protein